nr:DUF4376 domain-containing protein [Salmonella enterica]
MVKAELNRDMIATVAGDITVYHYDSRTREYLSSSSEYLSEGVGIPAHSCTDAPGEHREGFAICRTEDLTTWEYVVDYRGETVYSTATGHPVYITDPGPLPENTTTQPPGSPVDRFENGQWIPDRAAALNQKHDDINAWRNAQENAGYVFEFNGRNWDYGKATQERLALSVQAAKENRLPDGFIWTDADNNDVPVNADELLKLGDAISQAMFTKGLQIHMRQRAMKEAVDKLTDASAILAYPVGWGEEN